MAEVVVSMWDLVDDPPTQPWYVEQINVAGYLAAHGLGLPRGMRGLPNGWLLRYMEWKVITWSSLAVISNGSVTKFVDESISLLTRICILQGWVV